jgi:hypothetical protein
VGVYQVEYEPVRMSAGRFFLRVLDERPGQMRTSAAHNRVGSVPRTTFC